MANLNVTYSDMRDAAIRLGAGKDDILAKLNELDALINNLVSSGYVTDSSSKAFDSTFDQYIAGAKQTIEALDGMAQFLNSAAEGFQGSDDGLARSIGGN